MNQIKYFHPPTLIKDFIKSNCINQGFDFSRYPMIIQRYKNPGEDFGVLQLSLTILNTELPGLYFSI